MQAQAKKKLLTAVICVVLGIITGLAHSLTHLSSVVVLVGGIAVVTIVLVSLRQRAINMVLFCAVVVVMEIALKQ